MRSSWQFVRLREFFLSFMSFGRQRYFLLPFLFLLLFSVGGFFTTSNFLFSSLRSLSTCSRNAKGTEIKKKEKLCEIASWT